MKLSAISVSVKGKTRLVMNRFSCVRNGHEITPKEEAEKRVHRLSSGHLAVPAPMMTLPIMAALKDMSALLDVKTPTTPFRIEPTMLDLKKKRFKIDTQKMKVGGNGHAIVRHLPYVESWKLSFRILFDERTISADTLKKAVAKAGDQYGLAGRGNGEGKFEIVSWRPKKSTLRVG